MTFCYNVLSVSDIICKIMNAEQQMDTERNPEKKTEDPFIKANQV